MTIWHGLLLGLIEGLTEFLPISSTAHLIIASDWLRLTSSEFLKTFEISIQLGAILAIVVLYWKRVWNNWQLIGKVAAAFIPTALIGFALYSVIKRYLFESLSLIAWALIGGGILIIILEKYFSKETTLPETVSAASQTIDITYKQAIAIGCFQTLAVVPGVSRAGATIIGGLGLGLKRRDIVEFSFLLAIPTMAAATGLDLIKTSLNFSPQEILIWAAGFITAFFTAIVGVKFFLKFVQTNNFIPFGWYRIALGLAVLVTLWI